MTSLQASRSAAAGSPCIAGLQRWLSAPTRPAPAHPYPHASCRPTGSPTVDMREEDGKRTITKAGVYQGIELQLLARAPHCDPRLPLRPEAPHLDFSRELREVSTDGDWQEVRGRWSQACGPSMHVCVHGAGRWPVERLRLAAAGKMHGLTQTAVRMEHIQERLRGCIRALAGPYALPPVRLVERPPRPPACLFLPQLIRDQPWSSGRRRRRLCAYLQAGRLRRPGTGSIPSQDGMRAGATAACCGRHSATRQPSFWLPSD
jgi:hypothetical protein